MESIPSSDLAVGFIGTPPPSAGKFIAARKIRSLKLSDCSPPSSSLSFIHTLTLYVSILKRVLIVRRIYAKCPTFTLFSAFLVFEFSIFLHTIASSPIPELIPNILLYPFSVVTSPRSIFTPLVDERIFSRASSVFFGIPIPLAKSFPEPVGITPNRILSKSVIPFRTSLIVPSPPTTTRRISSSSSSEILLANSDACPPYFVTYALYSIFFCFNRKCTLSQVFLALPLPPV